MRLASRMLLLLCRGKDSKTCMMDDIARYPNVDHEEGKRSVGLDVY